MSELDTWPQYSKLVLEQLRIISEEIKMVKADVNNHRSISENKITKLETHLTSIEKEITQVAKLVRDGNGKPPLTVEVEILKEKQNNTDRKLKDLSDKYESITEGVDERFEEQKEDTKWKIETIIAIGAMIVSICGVLVNIFL